MRRHWTLLLLLLFSLGSITTALGRPANQQAAGAAAAQPSTNATAEGADVWAANCVRCHSAPERLSPREVRAVLRQMRVRANLSAKDEQLLLKFLAP